MEAIEKRTMGKVTWRLVPFLVLCYFIAYLDRVNVGFAGASMSRDLGLSSAAFGGAAGIFFIAYFFFEVPSNLALDRFGARRWIARIMLSWGLVSGAQAFVTGELGFTSVRLLLGIAEAGFFPGIIFYLTLWFPSAYRARIVSLFMFAMVLYPKMLLLVVLVPMFTAYSSLAAVEPQAVIALLVMRYSVMTVPATTAITMSKMTSAVDMPGLHHGPAAGDG